MIRSLRWALPFAAFLGVAPAMAGTFRVLEGDDAHVRVEFLLGDYSLAERVIDGESFHDVKAGSVASTNDPGFPALPVFTTLIGIPAGAEATVEIVDRTQTSVPRIVPTPFPHERIVPAEEAGGVASPTMDLRPDARFYDGGALYPSEGVELGTSARVRNQRVVALRVKPIQAHGGASGGLTVTDRIVVDVRFRHSQRRAAETTAMPAEGEREFIYRGVLNYEQARAWRNRRVQPVSSELRRYGRLGAAQEMKIRVRVNGLARVRYTDLAGAGWTETPLFADLALTTRGYDASRLDTGDSPFTRTAIGIVATDANGDGRFNGGDSFIFYGQDAATQRDFGAPQTRYGRENVYWLTVVPGGGTAMATRDAGPSGTPDATPTDFESWSRYEEDKYYYWYSYDGDDVSTRRQMTDHYLMTPWNAAAAGMYETGIRLPFRVVDPVPGTPFGFAAEWRAVGNVTSKVWTPSIVIGTGPEFGRTIPGQFNVAGDDSLLYSSHGLTLNSAFLGAGNHQFVTKVLDPEMWLSVNWYEVGYRRQYRLAERALLFTSAESAGHVRYTVAGVGTGVASQLLLVDLSNADMPVRLVNATLSPAGSTFDLVFDDTVTGQRKYLVQETASVPLVSAADMTRDTPSSLGDLSSAAIDSDYLVVVADEFAGAAAPLVAWREGLGHRCEVAKISDVYDEFSGGLFTPEAIREYVRYAYRMRPSSGGTQPAFLLLIGDGSEDYLGVVEDSGTRASAPTYVPVYMVIGEASDTGISKPLIASDHWFIENPDGNDASGDPYLSSMMVGRLPTASVEETEAIVQKILTYEQTFQAEPSTQEWRRRGLAVADDFYSGGFGGTAGGDGYRCREGEASFQRVSDEATTRIHAAGFPDFHVDEFYVSDMADTLAYLGRDTTGYGLPQYPDVCITPCCRVDCDNPDNWTCSKRYLRNVYDIDGRLIEMASKGHLFATYEGHGNRRLIAHETLMAISEFIRGDPGQVGDGFVDDVPRLGNFQRWPVWFYFACHLAEFAFQLEAKEDVGDSMAERMLLHPDVGSIASIASSGFEWLTSNDPVHSAVIAAWFERPELADVVTNFDGVYLGEVMLGAKNELAEVGFATYQGMVESYVTLGDPGLRLDIAPPRLQVWQDQGDRPWELPEPPPILEDGSPLRATSASSRDAHFAIRIFDETPIDSATVRVGREVGGTVTWFPPSAYTLEPGAAGAEGSKREWFLTFDTALEARDYALVFEATDFNQRVMRFELPAAVTVSFYDVGAAGDERPLSDGAFLDPSRVLRVRFDAPVALGPDEVNLILNDQALVSAVKTPLDGSPTAGDGSFRWRIDADLRTIDLNDGTNVIATEWNGGSGGTLSQDLTVSATGTFTLDRQFVYPNPFQASTDLFYRVTRPAVSARLRIYTLSGRLIRTIEQEFPTVDLNRIHWDGRDEDGDGVANGVYFYRFDLVAPDGTRSTKDGKIARVSGPAQ